MIDRDHELALTKQAALLGISRGSVYYEPAPVSAADLALMRRIDELHLQFPFAGSRMLRGLLAADGSKIGRRHVTTLMRRMGIEAIYRRPNTSKPAPGLVSRVSPVQTALRNCTRDEGGPFEFGNQVLISSHRKLLSSKAMVVNVAEKSERDFGRYD
jgi:hypothetical protein